MKSTIFLSASAFALFASAPAFAQNNVSTVNQSGNGANADVGQTGTADNSEVNQSAGAKAKVRQTGTNSLPGSYTPDQYPNNRSLITQSATNADADVDQNGTVNRSTIDQAAAAISKVRQNGTHNNSTIRQEAGAAGATATVTQLGSYGDNRSGIVQRGDSTATVTQTDGASNPPGFQYPGNQSDIDQTGDDNAATVVQSGDDNFSTVTQNATGAVATVGQTGSENSATTVQNASATSNIEQGNFNPASARNTAVVTQNANAEGSISDVNQNGIGNRADITQNAANQDSFNYTNGTDNRAAVEQNASRNVSVLLQNSNFGGNGANPATANDARVIQAAGSDNTYSYVYQDGRANIAQINLSGAGVAKTRQATSGGYVNGTPAESVVLTIGVNNKAYVDQAADRAAANIYQGVDSGYRLVLPNENNTARINQTASGDDSRSDILQGGSNNIAEANQSATFSRSNITQTGDGNTAIASQNSGTALLSNITQLADGNTAMTTQSGTNNTANVRQTSDGNMSTVNQSGSGSIATVTQGS